MFEIVAISLCLAINAALAAVEMALVNVSRPELRERARKGDPRSQTLLVYREHPERVLSVLQIGITLVGAISAAIGGAGAEENFAPVVQQWLGISEDLSELLAISAVVIPLTYLSVVIGELVPKTLALRHSLAIALASAPWIQWADRLLGPAVWVLERSTKLVLRLLGRSSAGANATEMGGGEGSGGEVLELGDLQAVHRQYVLNLARLEKRQATEAMIAWDKVDRITVSASNAEVLDTVIRSGHTRLPVVEADGRVSGVLHTKEFIAFVSTGSDNWNRIIRPIQFVRPGDGLLMLLRKFQAERRHLGVVGRAEDPAGIVTLEDIIEEVIGELSDEDDDGFVRRLITQRLGPRSR